MSISYGLVFSATIFEYIVCNAGDPGLIPGSGRSGKIPWRRDRLPTPVFWGFPCGSVGKEFSCSAEDLGSIAVLGRSPGEGKRYPYPLQYSGLENSMDCILHGVTKSWKRLNDFHSLERVVRSLIAIIQRGHNQLMHILLISWW